MVALASMEGEAVSAEAIAYVNRLSDFLFVAARWANDKGRADVLGSPATTDNVFLFRRVSSRGSHVHTAA